MVLFEILRIMSHCSCAFKSKWNSLKIDQNHTSIFQEWQDWVAFTLEYDPCGPLHRQRIIPFQNSPECIQICSSSYFIIDLPPPRRFSKVWREPKGKKKLNGQRCGSIHQNIARINLSVSRAANADKSWVAPVLCFKLRTLQLLSLVPDIPSPE